MPQNLKARQKPIPETVQGWAFELLGIWAFIRKRQFYIEKLGPKWFEVQHDYYSSRMQHLLDNPPEGARYTKTKILKG